MWCMDVCSKAWLLLLRAGSNPSLREEDSLLRSGSRRLRQLLHGTGSISHRFITRVDQWKTELLPRRNGRWGERMGHRQSPYVRASLRIKEQIFTPRSRIHGESLHTDRLP